MTEHLTVGKPVQQKDRNEKSRIGRINRRYPVADAEWSWRQVASPHDDTGLKRQGKGRNSVQNVGDWNRFNNR